MAFDWLKIVTDLNIVFSLRKYVFNPRCNLYSDNQKFKNKVLRRFLRSESIVL